VVVVIAVLDQIVHMVVADLLVVAIRPDGRDWSAPRTLHASFALAGQTSGVDVLWAISVGRKASMDHLAGGTVRASFFRDEEVVTAKGAETRCIS
jgi:hypothetical protein